MRFFFAAYCPTGNTAPGSGYCPAGNTPTLFVYCGCAAIRLTYAPIAPRAIRRWPPAIALRAIRLRCSSIAATPQYDSPMRLLPHGQYGAGSGYCPAGNTPTLFVYCGYAAIRLTHAPIAPRAIRRRHEQKKSTAKWLCSKMRLQSNNSNKSYFDFISLGKQ